MGHNSKFWDLAGQDVEDVVCLRGVPKKDTRASQLGGEGGVIWQVALLLMKIVLCFSSFMMIRCLVVNSQYSFDSVRSICG